jgi:transcriptional regulator with XRE-family HTH domain
LGVTRQYISEFERGVPMLYTDRLFALLRLLGGSLRARLSS